MGNDNPQGSGGPIHENLGLAYMYMSVGAQGNTDIFHSKNCRVLTLLQQMLMTSLHLLFSFFHQGIHVHHCYILLEHTCILLTLLL